MIDTKKYSPDLFVSKGNRYPPLYLCPKTAQGWLDIEKQFAPSTLRDEIRLTRMLLEYLEAKDAVQIKKRTEIVDWLNSLPEPQRVCMSSNLEANRFMYEDSMPITKPYLELLKAVYPMMTNYHQRQCKHYIPELPAPLGWQPPPRSIEETLKPTEIELAIKKSGKEPSDGLRVWKSYPPVGGEFFFTAKFDSVIEDGDIRFIDRDGRTFNVAIAGLDKSEISYISKNYPGQIPSIEYRKWTGDDKRLSIIATYVAYHAGMVTLKKENEHDTLRFELIKLSVTDQDYIQRRQKNPKDFIERGWHSNKDELLFYAKFISATDDEVTVKDNHGEIEIYKLSEVSKKDRDYVNLCKITAQEAIQPTVDKIDNELPTLDASQTSEQPINLTNTETTLSAKSSLWKLVPIVVITLLILIILGTVLFATRYVRKK
ncbi:MAG: hypothetical protein LBU65_05205 [Planctomycetaceae bacterium]|jgi:hypothetical protein|nr:hypothetical protein [Planctomycetaceae bacterium]